MMEITKEEFLKLPDTEKCRLIVDHINGKIKIIFGGDKDDKRN